MPINIFSVQNDFSISFFKDKTIQLCFHRIFTFFNCYDSEYFAGRFSAKESYGKALGTGIGKEVSFQGVEILNDALGNPYVNSHPKQDELIAHVSISHTDTCVMTEVILESKK